MNNCIRCNNDFEGRFPKSKICKSCTKQGMGRGKDHWNYKDGSYTYETIRQELYDEIRYCEICEKDIQSHNSRDFCIHHVDHNHYNNVRSNLQLLCRSCHAKEHNLIDNLEGATTISKESTLK